MPTRIVFVAGLEITVFDSQDDVAHVNWDHIRLIEAPADGDR